MTSGRKASEELRIEVPVSGEGAVREAIASIRDKGRLAHLRRIREAFVSIFPRADRTPETLR